MKRYLLHAISLVLLLSAVPLLLADQADVFDIRTAHLDGSDARTIYSDSYRQATHLRVSPDGEWIMFSRYNEVDPKDDLAKEHWGGRNHYENTELMLMRSDGSQLRSLVPAKKGIIAVNSNWTDDGRGFVFVSTDNEKRVPEIRRAHLSPAMEITHFTSVKLPGYLVPVDPHLHLGKLVFPAVDLRSKVRGLWIANEDGSELRQLTRPRHPETGESLTHPSNGDNDPRISPDGSQVAFMRLIEGHALWNIYVVDVATGRERNLSAQYLTEKQLDAVPEWSGDGELLIFWMVDIKKVTFNITTVRPDGNDRQTVVDDPDIFQQSPAFFPNTGSDAKARIAYSRQRVPQWKLRAARFLHQFK